MDSGKNEVGQLPLNERRSWYRPAWWHALIALPWVLGLLFCLWEARTHTQIAERQKTTIGTVTSHDPANHDSYAYTFTVGDKTYSGREFPRGNGKWTVGEHATVFYDPDNPNTSALSSFDRIALDDVGPVPLTLFGIGGVFILIWYMRRRNATMR